MSGTMERIAEIDQQIAELQSEGASRAAVDSIRDGLGSVNDYLSKTKEDIGAAKDRIESELEAARDGSHTQSREITAEDAKKFLDKVTEDDSDLDKWIKSATEAIGGLVSDFSKAGDPTPDELDEEISEFSGEFSGEIKDLLKGAGSASGGLKKLLEDKRVKEFTEGVEGGLDSTGNVLGGVTEGLGEIDDLLGWFQTVDDLTSDDAQTQLNALGDAFDKVVDSLGGSVTLIPGLGAFFHLYGQAFRGAATSAATIAASRDYYNDIFQTVDEGKFLYLTADALLQMKIARLEEERARLLEAGLGAAREERESRGESDAGSGDPTFGSDYEVAIELAFRASSDSQPPLRSDAYIAWSESSDQLAAAKQELANAVVNLNLARGKLNEAEIKAEHAQDEEAAQGLIKSERGGVERAEQRFDAATAEHTAAAEAHRSATADYRAEREAYNDVVRANVIRNAAKTNGGKGFTAEEWADFNEAYPQYAVTQAHLDKAAASNKPQDSGDAAPAAGAAAAVGGAAAGALATPKKNRRLLVGAGGALLLIGAIFILPNLGSDGEIKAGETTSSTQAESTTDSTGDASTEGDANVCAAAPLGCIDYGEPIFAVGTIVWEPGDSCQSTPSDVTDVGVNSSSTGWRVFIPGYGGCRIGDDGVTCPGEQLRGQRESQGVITLRGETLEVTEVLDNGFSGVAQDWTASPDADGNADKSTVECTNGGSFLFTTDPEPWQLALASPIAEESPMNLSDFACYMVPTDDGAILVWSMQAGLATADPPTPFQVSIETRLSSWITVPAEVLGVIDPTGHLGMTTLDGDGNVVTPPAYGDYRNSVDALASFLSEVLADGVDPYAIIEELGLNPDDPEGSLEVLKEAELVGVLGAHVFDPDNSEEEAAALEGFGPDTIVDAAGVLRNGRFAAFAPSQVCGS